MYIVVFFFLCGAGRRYFCVYLFGKGAVFFSVVVCFRGLCVVGVSRGVAFYYVVGGAGVAGAGFVRLYFTYVEVVGVALVV